MTVEEFEKAIRQIPGKDGFWKESTYDAFHAIAWSLVSGNGMWPQAMSYEDAIEMLTELYHAVAEEFGGKA